MKNLNLSPECFTDLRKDCYFITSSEGQLEFSSLAELKDYLQSFCDFAGKSISELPQFEIFRVKMFVQPKND